MQLIIPIHSWVIKKELLKIPLFGPGLRMMEVIAIDRNDATSVADILRQGKQKLEQGLSIVMFPEATRVKYGHCVKFKPSAAKLALLTNSPVALIVHNAGLLWPKGFWFSRPGIITVKVVEVISSEQLSNYDARTLTNYIEQVINFEKNKL